MLVERVGFASFRRVAPAADTRAGSAVRRIPSAPWRFPEERRVPLVRRSISHVMRRVEAFSSEAISNVPWKTTKTYNYLGYRSVFMEQHIYNGNSSCLANTNRLTHPKSSVFLRVVGKE